MSGVSVGHSASCVMCLVDTMWVPLVVSLSSLFKKAFSYTRGAGFAQVRGERGPTTWLGLHYEFAVAGSAPAIHQQRIACAAQQRIVPLPTVPTIADKEKKPFFRKELSSFVRVRSSTSPFVRVQIDKTQAVRSIFFVRVRGVVRESSDRQNETSSVHFFCESSRCRS